MNRAHIIIEVENEETSKAIESLCRKLKVSFIIEEVIDVCPNCKSLDIHHEHTRGKTCLDCSHKF